MPKGIYNRSQRGLTVIQRFNRFIDKSNKCWMWTGGKLPNGYGIYSIGRFPRLAHRMSYELAYGKVPGNLLVCHHCDVKLCVNPEHLFLGTYIDNMQDAVSKGRMPTGNKWVTAHPPESIPRGDNHYKIRKRKSY